MIRIEITGIQEALAGLKRYYNPERKKLMRKALQAAVKYLKDVAKRFLEPGTLQKSISTKSKYYGLTDTLVMLMGPKTWFFGTGPFGETQIAHKYAHLFEGGHKPVAVSSMKKAKTDSKGKKYVKVKLRTGQWVTFTSMLPAARGRKFMAKTVAQYGSRAIDIIKNTIANGLS